MYKKVYIPLDNSEYSITALNIGIDIAKTYKSKCLGSHVYAARLHDLRFKQMESGLPEQYQEDVTLEKQREIHDSLITKGLSIISDSYLDIFEKRCNEEGVVHERRSLEGRNYKELVRDITETGADLVVMGAKGIGSVKETIIGSVCERVMRRVKTDVLVVKNTETTNNRKIIVCVDGSPYAYGGIKRGASLGTQLKGETKAISIFDPYFHYTAFNNIAGILSEEAGKIFKFKEQEKLHEEVIDNGLAKIYQSHLEISKKIAQDEGVEVKIELLAGKPFEKILEYIRNEKPWLIVVGRTGVHSDDDIDIGSTTENLVRLAPCHVLITNHKFHPSLETTANETIKWTEDAYKRLEKIPVFARGMAKTAINQYAVDNGYTVITCAIIDLIMEKILPSSMKQSMGIQPTHIS